jgi:Ferritin-like domain
MKRRDFLAGAGAVSGTLMLQAAAARPAWAQAFRDDVDVLNYALVLEYFLSQFYRESRLVLTGQDAEYITAIGDDEDAHIAAITATVQSLGGQPAAAPAIDYGKALDSRTNLLKFALRFENLFAGAYLGAAGAIQNKDILQAAAGIFGTEERHAAVVANLLGLPAKGGVFVGAASVPVNRAAVEKEVNPFLRGAETMAGAAAVTR